MDRYELAEIDGPIDKYIDDHKMIVFGVCVCVYVYVSILWYVYVCICMCLCVFVCVCVCTFVSKCFCVCVREREREKERKRKRKRERALSRINLSPSSVVIISLLDCTLDRCCCCCCCSSSSSSRPWHPRAFDSTSSAYSLSRVGTRGLKGNKEERLQSFNIRNRWRERTNQPVSQPTNCTDTHQLNQAVAITNYTNPNYPFIYLRYMTFQSVLSFTPFRVFHTSVSRWFLTGVWVTASLLKSPGLFSVFWPISTIL